MKETHYTLHLLFRFVGLTVREDADKAPAVKALSFKPRNDQPRLYDYQVQRRPSNFVPDRQRKPSGGSNVRRPSNVGTNQRKPSTIDTNKLQKY